jgi:purine-binding chemotaxis protein CheW
MSGGQYVIFRVNSEEFGIGINWVYEIITPNSITKIPQSPPFVAGVINLRGRVITVVDLAQRLGLTRKMVPERQKIVIAQVHASVIGLLVDDATDVMIFDGTQVSPTPKTLDERIDTVFIAEVAVIGERLILLLDLTKLLGTQEVQHIREPHTE